MKKIVLICGTLLVGIGLAGCSTNNQQKAMDKNSKSEYEKNVPVCSVDVHKTDENYLDGEWMLSADKNGNYNLKLKINKDGQITITSKENGVYSSETNFKSKTYEVKKGEKITVPLNIKHSPNDAGATFIIRSGNKTITKVLISNPNNNIASTSSSTNGASISVPNLSTVKSEMKDLNDSKLIKKIKVEGFNTPGAGGSLIILANNSSDSISQQDVNDIIITICQKLNENKAALGTGVVIKINAMEPSVDHFIMVGHAYVATDDVSKINTKNISSITKDYENKGQ